MGYVAIRSFIYGITNLFSGVGASMSKTFEEWHYDNVEGKRKRFMSFVGYRKAWEAAQQAMMDGVIEIAKRHTMRPEAFIKDLKQKYGAKDE